MGDAPRAARARELIRGLNILLKSVRLYGFEHSRSSAQFQAAWNSLASLLPGEQGVGVMLAVSNAQLLVDGTPLETTPVERSIADLLSGAGLASVHFTARTASDDFAKFVRAFAAAGGKASNLAEQLRETFGTSPDAPIRVNNVRFVVEGEGHAEAGVAAALAVESLGPHAEKLKDWLRDPQKLLELIAAAEGLYARPSMATPSAGESGPASETDILRVMQLFSQIAQAGTQAGAAADPAQLQKQLGEMPAAAQALLQHGLANVASSRLPAGTPQAHVLVQLAEQLAIRHALARFERGEVKVDAVRETLQRLGREIENLRKILGAHEDKMGRAGMAVESHAEILDRQFWQQVPESGKRTVLLSPEAWCVPGRNVASYVEQLMARGDSETARTILRNLAACTRSAEAEPRRRAALVVGESAKLYAAAGDDVLQFALEQVARQLSLESGVELQEAFSDAFTKLSQEATAQKRYAVVESILQQMRNVADRQPVVAQKLRSRITIEVRIQDFVEDALRNGIPPDLSALLAREPQLAADQIVPRFARSTRREESERLIEMMQATGAPGTARLREMVERGSDAAAVSSVGLLSRLEPAALEPSVPNALPKWSLTQHDLLIRQLAFGNSPQRGVMLAGWLSKLHLLLQPEAIDEMGMAGDRRVSVLLLQIAGGELKQMDAPYTRLKAIEALGRLREPQAAALLRQLVESKKMWNWEHPHELRLVAAQALLKLDPPWAKSRLATSGLSLEELNLAPPLDPGPSVAWSRARRYPRLQLALSLPAVVTSGASKRNLAIKVLNLGGGLGCGEVPVGGGQSAVLEMRSGFRTIRAEVLVREARREQLTYEVVQMNFDERAKLRKLLASLEAVAI